MEGFARTRNRTRCNVVVLTCIVLQLGCVTPPIRVPLAPIFRAPAKLDRLPLTIGAYYSDQFRSYEHRELIGDSGVTMVRPIGQASVNLFRSAFASTFQHVLELVNSSSANTAAILEVEIEGVEVGPKSTGRGPGGDFAWAEITYRFTLREADGDRIASWAVSGRGQAVFAGFNYLQAHGLATNRAMMDAAGKFTREFRAVPEVQPWLRSIAVVE
jgi:hypothetical protein